MLWGLHGFDLAYLDTYMTWILAGNGLNAPYSPNLLQISSVATLWFML